MKGEPKKFDKSRAKQKARFPMRTIETGPDLLEYNQEFFETYDFILILFLTVIFLFVITSSLQVMPIKALEQVINTNLTFYVIILLITMVV